MATETAWQNVPEGMLFQYRITQRHGVRPDHIWALHNEQGGVHIAAWRHSSPSFGREWMGGIECHFAKAPEYMSADKPSHEHCWILHAPCWHDGSSLYFSENIAHLLPSDGNAMDDIIHGEMLQILIRWHRQNIVSEYEKAGIEQ